MTDLQKANLIAHEFTVEPHKRRTQDKRMTGEWVIYAKDSTGTNHYLAAANHSDDALMDQRLLELIRPRCEPRFVALLP